MDKFTPKGKAANAVVIARSHGALPISASNNTHTNAEMADVVAGFILAAAARCANRPARQKLQHALSCALDAATLLRRVDGTRPERVAHG